jgi:hypothetical protein
MCVQGGLFGFVVAPMLGTNPVLAIILMVVNVTLVNVAIIISNMEGK